MQITLGLTWDGTLDRLSSPLLLRRPHPPEPRGVSRARERGALETFLFCDVLYFYRSGIFGCLQGRRCQGSARPAQA